MEFGNSLVNIDKSVKMTETKQVRRGFSKFEDDVILDAMKQFNAKWNMISYMC